MIEIPKGLGPSNPSNTSTVDPVTGEMHVLVRHLPEPGAPQSIYFHYIGRRDGTWEQQQTNFAGNGTSLAVVGDRLYAFVGREKGQIYFAERADNFRTWERLDIRVDGRGTFDPEGGYITWDLSLIQDGRASMLWHKEPKAPGLSSPVQVFDIAFE